MEIHLLWLLPFPICWEIPAIPVVLTLGYGEFHSHSHWDGLSEVRDEVHEIQETNNMLYADLGEQKRRTDTQRPHLCFIESVTIPGRGDS